MNGKPSIADRFWNKVQKTESCWLWTAQIEWTGYGRFTPKKNHKALAHRFSYELNIGPIPEGMVLDHLCRNPACVNPDHLEPVRQAENQRRGLSVVPKNFCRKGHEFTPENTYTYIWPKSKKLHRSCRICKSIQRRIQYLKEKREPGSPVASLNNEGR